MVASLFTYLDANYNLTKVDHGGSGVDEENLQEWVRADVMFTIPRYSRQVDQQGHFGAEPLIMLNMNVFVKQTALEVNTYRLKRLSDTLKNLFRVPQGILVKDHVENAGANTIGVLQTSEIEVRQMPFDSAKGIYGCNVTSTMRYVFSWEAPS